MRKVMLCAVASCVLLVLIIPSADAGWLSSAWKKVKSAGKAVVSAPFRLVGTAVGPGVKAAFDPALDGAFQRGQQLTDYAADKFRGVLNEQTEKLDAIGKKRLEQFDTIIKGNIAAVDVMLDEKLKDFNTIATGLLDRQADIIDGSLTRVDLILDRNVTRIEQLTDRSITRLEGLQADTFDRINATLQDQVPFAASSVARELVSPILIVGAAIVLLGFVGYRMRQGVPWKPTHGAAPTTGWRSWLLPRHLLGQTVVAGVAVACVGFLAWGTATIYFKRTDYTRATTLAKAAESFEKIGDFRSSWSVYRRAAMLWANPENQFRVERARFLADFAQPTLLTDASDFLRRYGSIRAVFESNAKSDAELEAVRIYLSANLGAADVDGSPYDWSTEIDTYEKKFLSEKNNGKDGAAKNPRLGKLVLVTKLRLKLSAEDESISERLKNAQQIAERIVAYYGDYAQARAALVNLLSIRRETDSLRRSPSLTADDKTRLENAVEANVTAVLQTDPYLHAMMKLRVAELDQDTAKALAVAGFTFAPQAPAAGADQPTMDRYAAEKKLADKLANIIDAFAETLMQDAIRSYSHPALARAEVERLVARAIKRDVGMVQLNALIWNARAGIAPPNTSGPPAYAAAMAVAQKAIEIDQLAVAEAWIEEAGQSHPPSNRDETQRRMLEELTEAIRKRPLSEAYPTVL